MSQDRVAIIDIGSNAVRLAVYDGPGRAPFRLRTERIICNLGAGLAATGRLDPAGMEKALAALRRFAALLKEMQVKKVRAAATAAVREAANGGDFVARVKKECGLSVSVIGGEEEARLSALGVLANGFGGTGVIGDYGGGSLELILVENYRVVAKASLPLGSHRLLAQKTFAARVKLVESQMKGVEFLKDCAGLDFYALGGAWRALGKAHMRLTAYPLPLLDQYQVEGKKAAGFARQMARKSPAALEKSTGLSSGKVRDMGVAALAMEVLFKKIRPARLIFSGTGLREGLLFDLLKPAVLKQDALLSSCAKIAGSPAAAKAAVGLCRWLEPLFANADAELARLVAAGCLLACMDGPEHEDFQAGLAFRRILALPLYGASHAARAFLAVSQYVRHAGKLDADVAAAAQKLMDRKMLDTAVTLGLAQRMGFHLCGGALGALRQAELEASPKKIVLKLKGRAAALDAGEVREALNSLAGHVGKKAQIS